MAQEQDNILNEIHSGAEALSYVNDEELDYIFIDARHDYCAVHEDIKCNHPFFFFAHVTTCSLVGEGEAGRCLRRSRLLLT